MTGDGFDIWAIRIVQEQVRRESADGKTISHGEEGPVEAPAARVLCERGDAVRVDGCQGETADGSPCTRDADEGDYCHQHEEPEGSDDGSDED